MVALEGGYNLKSISNSMEAVVRVLLNDPLPRFVAPPAVTDDASGVTTLPPALRAPKRSALQSIRSTMRAHEQYWPCLKQALRVFGDADEEPATGAGEQAFAYFPEFGSDSDDSDGSDGQQPQQQGGDSDDGDGSGDEREPGTDAPLQWGAGDGSDDDSGDADGGGEPGSKRPRVE